MTVQLQVSFFVLLHICELYPFAQIFHAFAFCILHFLYAFLLHGLTEGSIQDIAPDERMSEHHFSSRSFTPCFDLWTPPSVINLTTVTIYYHAICHGLSGCYPYSKIYSACTTLWTSDLALYDTFQPQKCEISNPPNSFHKFYFIQWSVLTGNWANAQYITLYTSIYSLESNKCSST